MKLLLGHVTDTIYHARHLGLVDLYVAHDQGYRVQPAVKKTEQAELNDAYDPNY